MLACLLACMTYCSIMGETIGDENGVDAGTAGGDAIPARAGASMTALPDGRGFVFGGHTPASTWSMGVLN